jgi:ABC-type branched-subunit amino acid transport system permease subunit
VATFLATYDFLLVSMVLAAVLALTLYLPLMAGQLSVASPGFYALGGYIAAIMSTKIFPPGPGLYPVSLVLLEMAVAAVVSGVLGLAVGLPALRLRGIFLALATIAFVQILGVVALNLNVTGGAIGIFGIPQPFSSALRPGAPWWRCGRTSWPPPPWASTRPTTRSSRSPRARCWPGRWGRSARTSSTRGTRARGRSTPAST